MFGVYMRVNNICKKIILRGWRSLDRFKVLLHGKRIMFALIFTRCQVSMRLMMFNLGLLFQNDPCLFVMNLSVVAMGALERRAIFILLVFSFLLLPFLNVLYYVNDCC